MKPGLIVKQFKSKKGNAVTIRYPQESDLDQMISFVNDLVEEETFLMMNKKISRAEEAKFLDDSLKKINDKEKILLVAEVNGVYAGNCEIRRRTRRQIHVGEIGIAIGAEFREEGIGQAMLKVLIEEAKKLKLRILVLNCFTNNPRAIHVYESLGFRRAGTIPGMYLYKGEYIGDEIFYLPLV